MKKENSMSDMDILRELEKEIGKKLKLVSYDKLISTHSRQGFAKDENKRA